MLPRVDSDVCLARGLSASEPLTTTMSTTVRPLTKADEATWRKLFLAYHEYYKLTPDDTVISTTFARFLDDSEPMFASLAVSESGEPVGLVHWLTHRSTLAVNDYIYLHDLFVVENTRSRGIGRKLIEHVYEDADKRKAARVYWQTQVRAALVPVSSLAPNSLTAIDLVSLSTTTIARSSSTSRPASRTDLFATRDRTRSDRGGGWREMRSSACNDCVVGNRRAEDLLARRAPSLSMRCGCLSAGEQLSTVLARVEPPVERWCRVAAVCGTRDCICCLSAGS